MIRINGNISLGNYDGFVTLYNEAGRLYKNNGLQNYGLDFLLIYDFVSARSKESLSVAVCDHYLKGNEPDEAFRYLKLLKEQELPAEDAKQILIRMGIKMALKDYKSAPQTDPDIFVEKYTDSDEWFANFAKSYLKEWNRLKKEDRR